MKITPDTTVLVRAVVRDDLKQAKAAAKVLREAELVAVSLASLCELVWVLRRVYKFNAADAGAAIRALRAAANVEMNQPGVDAGLAMLDSGGDFADAVIAFEGNWLGGDMFVSFDKAAVFLLNASGKESRLLA